jgi:hypothetical protein
MAVPKTVGEKFRRPSRRWSRSRPSSSGSSRDQSLPISRSKGKGWHGQGGRDGHARSAAATRAQERENDRDLPACPGRREGHADQIICRNADLIGSSVRSSLPFAGRDRATTSPSYHRGKIPQSGRSAYHRSFVRGRLRSSDPASAPEMVSATKAPIQAQDRQRSANC